MLLAISLLLTACPNQKENPTPECEKKWELGIGKSGSIEINSGLMTMKATPQDSLIVLIPAEKALLTGDFELTVTFENFKPSSEEGSVAELSLFDPNNFQTLPTLGLGKSFLSVITDRFDFTPIDTEDVTKQGSFYVKRQGKELTLVLTANGKNLSVNYTFTDKPLQLFITTGFYPEEFGGSQTQISIQKIEVKNGGGKVKSDDFDCNSVND
ncbi:MAG: hypothetical protein H7Y04_10240 [Verrucomicrobia bacterium]|nr:hypothetical protein [Cytophagales bacterium]